MIAGAVAGIGGAWWPIGTVGRFDQNITGGRGFIALAAVIFGRWHPVGAFSGAMVFALAEAVRLKIGNFDTGIPSEFLLMAPYLVTLVVVAGFVGASRAPKAAGQPLRRTVKLFSELFSPRAKRDKTVHEFETWAVN